ncbi:MULTISPECIES: cupin-like domain-containing protein [unclassified Burkholderia]|uniref:cupin-like domain-containing protein n=1 Tax=unclassified Burkholderia TaxID=2613784 RepID=UPI000B0153BF|nr:MULTISPECIES: cupin-like domain-containing protein [unclassified Burkholderia]
MELFCNIKSILCRHISRNFLPGYQGGIVQFIVSDETDGKFYADISENIRFLDGVCEAPDAVVEMSAAVFRMLIEQPYATLEDTVKVTGNRALVSLIAHAAQPEVDSGRTRLRDLTLQVTDLALPETEVHRMATVDARQLMQILHGGTPVILTAMLNASGWRTTFDELQQRFGHLPLAGLDADILGATLGLSTLGALIDATLDGDASGVYSGGCALPGPMHEMFELPLLNRKCFTRPQLWMGRQDFRACTRLHRDFLHAFIGQVIGSKRFVLYRPDDAEYLYPGACFNMFQIARFDPFRPDLTKFPLARRAKSIECELHPGELLILPVGWFHTVRGDGAVMSVNRFMREDAWAVLSTRGGLEARQR